MRILSIMTNKSQVIRQNNWIRENKDVFRFLVPKGQKAEIEAHYKARGYKSFTAYIKDLINKDMNSAGQ